MNRVMCACTRNVLIVFILGLKRSTVCNHLSTLLMSTPGQTISTVMSATEEAKVLRASAKRSFTRTVNNLKGDITKKCSIEHITTKYEELKKRYNDIETIHDKYLMFLCKEDEDLEEKEEEWFIGVQNDLEQFERLKADYIRQIQGAQKVESESEVQRKRLERI